MAASGATSSTGKPPAALDAFLAEVKAIQKRDSVLTPSQQIDRLLRQGSMYFNLNPFEVLLIDPDTPPEQVRKAYRKLSILVHPDKNESDKDRAQLAFEAVHKAYKMLDDEDQRAYVLEMVEDAKAKLDMEMEEKRKVVQRQGKDSIEEDDPEKYRQALRNTLTKLFADVEMKKKKLEERDQSERKRQKEQEGAEQDKVKRQKEWKQDWDAKRNDRVDSWRTFQQKGKKRKMSGGLKPPKLKQEKRL
ncbi:DnaJ homolog subfamily C member 8 [Geodia barretti]|uniref:DnaJ homolog subfamily C member 8 n=4 Tax=Geodia barretti TaxID=519541 RepID=A0AA35RAV0_GEOBA|nr:DnaJ homolog subfamily C member 8 [Geodia barretti]